MFAGEIQFRCNLGGRNDAVSHTDICTGYYSVDMQADDGLFIIMALNLLNRCKNSV